MGRQGLRRTLLDPGGDSGWRFDVRVPKMEPQTNRAENLMAEVARIGMSVT